MRPKDPTLVKSDALHDVLFFQHARQKLYLVNGQIIETNLKSRTSNNLVQLGVSMKQKGKLGKKIMKDNRRIHFVKQKTR